jgi:hypothetical protein
MKIVTAETYTVRLYLSGPIESAKTLLRRECMREGLCVTVEPTLYIYTGGEETGYVVGLLNYPRFPSEPEALKARAKLIAEMLVEETYQHSALIVAPDESIWVTKREGQ